MGVQLDLDRHHIAGVLLIAKSRDTMLEALELAARNRQGVAAIGAKGLGVVTALFGSYGALSLGGLGRAAMQPVRQPIGFFAQVNHMRKVRALYTPTMTAGTDIMRSRLQDRGYFVLLTGRLAVVRPPQGAHMFVSNDYQIEYRTLFDGIRRA